MRRLNLQAVLHAIRESDAISRTEIGRRTGLSKPTVREVVEALLEAGYVAASGKSEHARPGPRAELVSFRADAGHVLGLDIGANKVLAAVADLAGEIVATRRRRIEPDQGVDALLASTRATISQVLRDAGVARKDLRAVAVGTPGVVDPATGAITLAPQLPEWEGIQLAKVLGRSFSCPILVENEVHLSVIGERWRGAAQGIDDAVYVQLGVGIGAGIMIGGEVYRGAGGAAGELGSLPFPGDDDEPSGLGAFERVAGGRAYARLGAAAAAGPGGRRLTELAGGEPERVDAETVFVAAAEGDPAAVAVVEEIVARVARGIGALIAILNPATVIIGGGISRAGSLLLDPLDRHLQTLVPFPCRLVLSSLGDQAVALGAVRRAIDKSDETLFAFEGAETA
jgi:predicted NBD/HSP70 family sugar kinase